MFPLDYLYYSSSSGSSQVSGVSGPNNQLAIPSNHEKRPSSQGDTGSIQKEVCDKVFFNYLN